MINDHEAEPGFVLDETRQAVPFIENTRVRLKSGRTYWVTAIAGYYIASTDPIRACPLPSEITGYTEIDPATNCWIAR